MVKEHTNNTLKARISSQIRKMAYDGLRIILYNWKGDELSIHTTEDENVSIIACQLMERFPECVGKINISVFGDTKVMQL